MDLQLLETVLRVNDLNISFLTNETEFEAVRGVSFDVKKGETIGIVGESGSGKSVTARSLTIPSVSHEDRISFATSLLYEANTYYFSLFPLAEKKTYFLHLVVDKYF